jgi:hypothetical protein
VFSWTEFLNRFESLVPDGVGISSVRPDFGTLEVDISGSADDMAALTGFIDRLTASEYFADAPPVFHTNEVEVDRVGGRRLQMFRLRIEYRPGGSKGAPQAGREG